MLNTTKGCGCRTYGVGNMYVLETTWKQARNESFKVHEMEQLYYLTRRLQSLYASNHKTMACNN
jgi:hypothetical protein